MSRFLSQQDICEATGALDEKELYNLDRLEILFTSFDEINSLTICPKLQELSLIDNGLKVISNLAPVSSTLRILRICDQELSSVEIIDAGLMQLEELYLHRNNITSISLNTNSFKNMANLKILWMSQNKLTHLPNQLLSNLKQLQELRIECNDISDLDFLVGSSSCNCLSQKGFMNSKSDSRYSSCTSHPLTTLGLSGNPIKSVQELLKLKSYHSLTRLSLQDIHYGKCLIVSDHHLLPLNYDKFADNMDKEQCFLDYIIVQLPQVRILDGIKISLQRIDQVRRALAEERWKYQDSLRIIDEEYRKEIKNIEVEDESRESHINLLERETTSAYSELKEVVFQGKAIMTEKFGYHKGIMDGLSRSTTSTLNSIFDKAQLELQQCLVGSIGAYDKLSADYYMLSNICSKHDLIMSQYKEGSRSSGVQYRRTWQAITNLNGATTDFQTIAQQVQRQRSIRLNALESCELMRLYRIHSDSRSVLADGIDPCHIHGLATDFLLRCLMREDWDALDKDSDKSQPSILFCDNVEALLWLDRQLNGVESIMKRDIRRDSLTVDRSERSHDLKEDGQRDSSYSHVMPLQRGSCDYRTFTNLEEIYGKALASVNEILRYQSSSVSKQVMDDPYIKETFPILEAAKQTQLVQTLLCRFDSLFLDRIADYSRDIDSVSSFRQHLHRQKGKFKISINSIIPNNMATDQTSFLYVIPTREIAPILSSGSCSLDYITAIMSPPVNGGVEMILGSIERQYRQSLNHAELVHDSLSNTNISKPTSVLMAVSDYEDQMKNELRNYAETLYTSFHEDIKSKNKLNASTNAKGLTIRPMVHPLTRKDVHSTTKKDLSRPGLGKMSSAPDMRSEISQNKSTRNLANTTATNTISSSNRGITTHAKSTAVSNNRTSALGPKKTSPRSFR